MILFPVIGIGNELKATCIFNTVTVIHWLKSIPRNTCAPFLFWFVSFRVFFFWYEKNYLKGIFIIIRKTKFNSRVFPVVLYMFLFFNSIYVFLYRHKSHWGHIASTPKLIKLLTKIKNSVRHSVYTLIFRFFFLFFVWIN